MKKMICFICMFALILLSGCEDKKLSSAVSSLDNESSQRNVRYNAVNSCYQAYNTAKELVDASKVVVSGKVTGFTFVAVDRNSYEVATDETAQEDKEIFTIYTVEVITPYKYINDNVPEKLNLWIEGGFEDMFIEEQLEALGGSDTITIAFNRLEIEIGKTYLFSLLTENGIDAFVRNSEQSAIDLSDPQNKDRLNLFTAQDIIDCFD